MKIFISGGCKSGKSARAQEISQRLRKPGAPLYYLATMIPADSEDEARIAKHRAERSGCGFETVEAGREIFAAVDKCDVDGVFLLDSVTALLANEMFAPAPGGGICPDGCITPEGFITPYRAKFDVCEKVADDLARLLNRLNDIVIVSDYIYSDAFLYDGMTETYRRGLAHIDRRMAALCDVVLEACCGIYTAHKGGEFLYGIY